MLMCIYASTVLLKAVLLCAVASLWAAAVVLLCIAIMVIVNMCAGVARNGIGEVREIRATSSAQVVLLYYCTALLYNCFALLHYCITVLSYCITILHYCIIVLQ